jgi:hypothetical protein
LLYDYYFGTTGRVEGIPLVKGVATIRNGLQAKMRLLSKRISELQQFRSELKRNAKSDIAYE